VRGGDSAPDAFIVDAGLGILLSVNVSDALAVVEGAGLAVLAALNSDESGVFFLGSLSSLESHENGLGVKSVQRIISFLSHELNL